MTISEWLALGSFLAVLAAGLPVIRAVTLRLGASPEVARKSVHVAMGLLCVSFAWVFTRPLPVWVLAAVATVPLALLRVVPAWRTGIGSALHGIRRPSYGEVLFAPAVAAVFHLSAGDPFRFGIPIGILAIADAASALAGTQWGKHRYVCGDGYKSIEGSLVFLATGFACVFLPLVAGGGVDAGHALWIGLTIGLLAMMAEGLADRGFDNLVIPLGCFFLLDRLLPLETAALAWRFGLAALLMALVLTGSRWSSLSGGALLGCALLGYGCAVLADWRFLLPPLGVFACHLVVSRRHQLSLAFAHRLDAVLCHAIGCLPWVLAVERGWLEPATGLAGVAFAMATQLGLLDTATHWWLHQRPARLPRALAKGWLLAALPGLAWLAPRAGDLALPVPLALASTAAGIAAFRHRRLQTEAHPTRLWLLKGFVALLSSLPALLLEK